MSISRRDALRFGGLGLAAFLHPPFLSGCSGSKDEGTEPLEGLPLDNLPGLDPNTPWWLQQNFAPVEEREELDLEVIGAIPPELDGLYVRNGSNAKNVDSFHWFVGDGMLHGVRIQGGKALWYRNRYIHTPLYLDDRGFAPPTPTDHNANVSIFEHGGKLLASGEVGFPYEVSAQDLSTIGVHGYDGVLQTAMTAHPKIDAVNGEMLSFGYSLGEPPYLTYHRIDSTGAMVQVEPIDVPGPSMMHNFEATASSVVFMDLPILFDLPLAIEGKFPFKWNDDYGARLGVMPREGTNDDVVWFDIDPCYIFHTFNAYDQGDEVVVEALRYERLWVDGPDNFDARSSTMQYTLNPSTGAVREDRLDDRLVEFPQIDRRLVGRKHRYGYGVGLAAIDPERPVPAFRGIAKYDRQGATQSHDMPLGLEPGEAYFVPASDSAGEDEGWLVFFVYNYATDRSELWLLDAQDITKDPVARIKLPFRVPHGFHGTWVPMG